jgi:hypothetical protein
MDVSWGREPKENIQHPTSNIEHPMALGFGIYWMLSVRCWLLVVPRVHGENRCVTPGFVPAAAGLRHSRGLFAAVTMLAERGLIQAWLL